MIAVCLLQYHLIMSGLPKRKYEKLAEDIELATRRRCSSTCSVQSFLEELSGDQPEQPSNLPTLDDNITSNQMPARQDQGVNSNQVDVAACIPTHSIDRLFSLNSSLDQDNDSSEHISAQFFDVFHRVSSLHSESWFTASSLMGESMTNSADMPGKLEQSVSSNGKRSEEEPNQTVRPVNPAVTLSTEPRLFSPRRLAESHRRTTLGDARSIFPDPESTQATQNAYVAKRYQWQRAGRAYSTESPLDEHTVETLMLPFRISSPTSPAKLLRMRWKNLFTPKHIEQETPPLSSLPSTTGRSLSRKVGIPLEAAAIPKHEEDTQKSNTFSPVNECFSSRISVGASHTNRSTRSARVDSETSYSLPCNMEDKLCSEQAQWEQRARPEKVLKTSYSCARLGSPHRLRRRWLTERVSLPSPEYFELIGSRMEVVQGAPGKFVRRFPLTRQRSDPTEEVTETEFARALKEKEELKIPGPANEYKTSFEREEELAEKLIEREAHIGAFALAWATTNRKTKSSASRTPSAGFSVDRQIDSTRASQLMAETVDRGFLGKSMTGTISNQILGTVKTGRDDACSSSEPERDSFDLTSVCPSRHLSEGNPRTSDKSDPAIKKDKAITDAVQMLGETTAKVAALPVKLSIPRHHGTDQPGGKSSKRSQHMHMLGGYGKPTRGSVSQSTPIVGVRKTTPHFHWRISPRARSTSTKKLTATHIEEEEVSSPAVTPTCTRVQSRRGAQDIPLLRSTGSPLSLAQQPLIQKSQAHNIGWRLSQRKILNERRRQLADYSFVLAVTGILLMVLNLEFVINNVYDKNSIYCLLMKALISASTVVLVGLMIFYHVIDIKLFSVNNCIEDWRIATNCKKLSYVTLEVVLCMIHPPPIISNYDWPFQDNLRPLNEHIPNDYRFNSPTGVNYNMSERTTNPQFPYPCVPPDPSPVYSEHMRLEHALSIPMFFRLFLIFRVLLLHSSFFTDAGSRSIGALNRVKINVRFVLKTLATAQPGTMLLIFIMFMWIITSWIMRICEREQNSEYERMFNTMWLIAVTFLSIGYGDMVPHTYCGRSISVIAGVMGSACTALVVAVVARKLELSRAEKHVHNFMQDNKIYKQLRHSAANVLRETWLFYKHTRLVKRVRASRVRRHQRKFLAAINRLRKAKDDQRKLKEDANSMVDLAKLQSGIHEVVSHIRSDQAIFVQRLVSVEKSLNQLQVQLSELPETLTELLKSPTQLTEMPAQEVSDDDSPPSFTPKQIIPNRSFIKL